MRIDCLADSLQEVGEHGADAFYSGDLARAIVAEFEAGDGILTSAELAGYRAIVRQLLSATWAGGTVSTNPAPAVGGLVLAALVTPLADRPGRVSQEISSRAAGAR